MAVSAQLPQGSLLKAAVFMIYLFSGKAVQDVSFLCHEWIPLETRLELQSKIDTKNRRGERYLNMNARDLWRFSSELSLVVQQIKGIMKTPSYAGLPYKIFKARALSHMLMGSWNYMNFKVPSNPTIMILWLLVPLPL